ncbi:Pancreatic triacylglycerol lipase [Armadillidium nasatum]|uniref:Pancreatic triacylglycerol lipase n=1 Tax=Armadillidium nasatum TaxID=96803 RepID=A0A5N5T2A1_9CRUS|nr:Pancreatic triacylglycerol lipase [Armadillidium nasatum]
MKTRKPNSSFTAFTHNGYRQWLKDMAAALLQYGDYNVLRVDWGQGSLTLPDQALANTKVVGEEIAYFVNTLKGELNVNVSKCHCIGHSMGGYVCGFAGQGIDKLGRITALDPAPKEFFEVENNEKLDPSDAEFVDAIHTGFSLLNILPSIAVPQPVGHLDFYVNEGHYQTGCYLSLTSLLNPTNNLEENLIDLVANEVTCGHLRPIFYYIESILEPSCQWVSYECSSFERFQKGECASCGTDSSKCGLLGPRAIEYTDKSREKVVLFIKTAAESPFCVQHYVVSISTGIIVQDESPSGGVITFEVIGSTGYFTEKLEIKKNITLQTIRKSLKILGKISAILIL